YLLGGATSTSFLISLTGQPYWVPVRKLRGTSAYESLHLRRWLRSRGIRHRIARKGIEPSDRLGRHRWVIERTVSWLAGSRRLHRRYERKADHFLAFAGIAAALMGLSGS
ncbi:transposase, partial [Streptomyces erythrochromogenes]|uniref:transposase n=1 Tax=Streptomyces erythrochromogenes TaxID=285574 RepID=UPI0034395789